MSRPADFNWATRELLRERAGNHCSFPGCYAPTSGPSEESSGSVSKTGMACHIVAASDGPAARRVKDIPVEELMHPSNGVWMCSLHGKLVDTDESQYTVELLTSWKDIAELRATLAQKYGWNTRFDPKLFSKLKLPNHVAAISGTPRLNNIIAGATYESCVAVLWGQEQADAARDVMIEIARNAFEHGRASRAQLEIAPLSMRLVDDGTPFDSSALQTIGAKRGGALAIEQMMTAFHHSLYFSSTRTLDKNCNEIALVRSRDDIVALTKCTIEMGLDDLRREESTFEVLEGCETVYVIFPDVFASSDVLRLPHLIASRLPKGKEYVFVGRGLSRGAVQLAKQLLPNIRVINFEYGHQRE